MKQKDIVTLLVAGFIGGALSLIISNFIFGSTAERTETVKTVEPISTQFEELTPDTRYFNKDAINPTQLIRIGNETKDDKDIIFQPE